MFRIIGYISHLVIALILTVLTQVGGVVWLFVFYAARFFKRKFPLPVRIGVFGGLYLLISFTLVPLLASLSGRAPLPMGQGKDLAPLTILTVLCNRHYVKKELKKDLKSLAESLATENPGQKLYYLDANFPLIDGFPLMPHKSHDDGKKVDFSFYYTQNGQAVDDKPSRSGYGVFSGPKDGEIDQPKLCRKEGRLFYSFTKRFTLGSREGLALDENKTARLIEKLIALPNAKKIFIEPHLKERMGFGDNEKVRFQGCASVRHDDHIHFEIE